MLPSGKQVRNITIFVLRRCPLNLKLNKAKEKMEPQF